MSTSILKASLVGAALGWAVLAAPRAEAAFVIDYAGVAFPSQISAQATYSFSDVGSDVRLSIGLANDSTIVSRLVAYGFDLPTGQFSSVAFTQTNGWNMNLNDGVGGPFGTFSVCIESDNNNNCGGNNPALGIVAGAMLTFEFTIDTTLTAGAFEAAMLALHNQPIVDNSSYHSIARFQAIGTGGDSDRGLPGSPTNPNPGPVPEPATLALFGVGLAGLGALARRRRRA